MFKYVKKWHLGILSSWEHVEIWIGILTLMSIIFPALLYFKETPARNLNNILAAWQTVSSMEEKRGSGGRESAIAKLKRYGEDLSGINLNQSILREIDLSDTEVSDISFVNAKLSQSSFEGSHLSCFDFSASRFLNRASLGNARITKSNFASANFADANYTNAVLDQCYGDAKTSFNGCSLVGAELKSCVFNGSNFNNIFAEGCLFIDTVLDNASFMRASLTNANWSDISGRSLNLTLIDAEGFSVGGASDSCDLSNARLNQATLNRASFRKVNLSHASFFGSSLKNATFVNSNLTGTDFSSCDLSDVRIERCIIDGTNFSATTKRGTQLIDCQGAPLGTSLSTSDQG